MVKLMYVILGSCLLVGCASTPQVVVQPRYMVYVPEKIATPAPPKLKTYDTRYGLDYPANFRKFQENSILLTDYAISLRETVNYYESQIDNLTKEKEKLESQNHTSN